MDDSPTPRRKFRDPIAAIDDAEVQYRAGFNDALMYLYVMGIAFIAGFAFAKHLYPNL